MAPCLEIVTAKPTEAFRKDPTLAYPIYEVCEATEGCLGCVCYPHTSTRRLTASSIFYGFSQEDPDVYMFAVRKSSPSHHVP